MTVCLERPYSAALTLAQAAPPPPPSGTEVSLTAHGLPEPGDVTVQRGVRIVIAEDDPVVSHRLRHLLEDEGFVVVGLAADTDAAIPLVQELNPDVVLSDLRMPGGGGLALLDQLSQNWPGVAVVLLTGYEDPGLRNRALAAGAAAFLSKGCSADEIFTQLLAAAARRRPVASEDGHPADSLTTVED